MLNCDYTNIHGWERVSTTVLCTDNESSESGSTDRNTLGYLITGSVGVLEFAGVRSCGERLYNLLAAEVSSRKCNSEDSPFISVRHGWGSELG